MVIVSSTKIYSNNQTVIPKEIREALNITENTIIDWDLDKNNNVRLIFKQNDKKPSIRDIVGLVHTKEKTNAVELDRELYR